MNTYYRVEATAPDGSTDQLFGSFVRSECAAEIDAEKDSWKGEGYKRIKITSHETTDTPDPEV